MQERIVELLVYLMSELRSRKTIGDINVGQLSGKGYTDAEISTAFAWLFDKLDTRSDHHRTTEREASVRHLHEVERSVLTSEGYGYLLQCSQLGLLTTEDVELVIERIMLSGVPETDLEDVKRVIASVLFETDRPAGGGYPRLGPTDSIH